MLNLPKCVIKQASHQKVAASIAVLDQGYALVSVIEDGVLKVELSTGVADEDFRGFSQNKFQNPQYAVNTQEFSAPGATPYVYNLAKTPFGVEYNFYIAGTQAVVVTTGTPTTGQVKVEANGKLTFAAADAGKDVKAVYRYQLTQAEAIFLFGNDPVPFVRQEEVQTSIVEVGLVFTDAYVISDDWATAKYAYLAADGLLTTDDTGTRVGPVAGLPYANEGFLGVEISV